VETVVEQNRVEVEEARERVDAYLRAWRLPDAVREEVAAAAMASIEARFDGDPQKDIRVAIQEAENALRSQLANEIPPLTPNRAPETHPMTMETSLTRLPSFRIIAGWFLLIALIVLAFILTR
jgi:hypothetical protein